MKRLLRAITPTVALLAIVVVVGLIVMITGIMPIRASDGHWTITTWVLDLAKVRSVSTHSLGIVPPNNLDERRLIIQGAGHYETGCVQCHGSPASPPPLIPQRMTPRPPYLPDRVDRWEASELFSLTKHGILFTGMPAFPSQQRDDEVWAVVAFLQELPNLDRQGYRERVYGELPEQRTTDAGQAESEDLDAKPPPSAVVQSCFRCHGEEGDGRGGVFPRLAGQNVAYLKDTLRAYAVGERHSGMMQPIAVALDEDTIEEVANYFNQQTPLPDDVEADASLIESGRAIALQGLPKQRVGSCVACHGPTGETNDAYPKIAGQSADFLRGQLVLFQQRKRGGGENARLMHAVVDGLKRDQIEAVSAYYASLPASASDSGEANDTNR